MKLARLLLLSAIAALVSGIDLNWVAAGEPYTMRISINAARVTQGTRKVPVELELSKPAFADRVDLLVRIEACSDALDCDSKDVLITRDYSNPLDFKNQNSRKIRIWLEFRRPSGEYGLIVEAKDHPQKGDLCNNPKRTVGKLIEAASIFFMVEKSAIFSSADDGGCLYEKALLQTGIPANRSLRSLTSYENQRAQVVFQGLLNEREEQIKQRVEKTIKRP